MFRKAIGGAAIVLALASTDPAAAQRVKAGVLNCDVSGGIGLIVGSQRSVRCTFTPDRPGPLDYYAGTISRFGLDIGATAGGQMVWGVYAEFWGPRSGALAGDYTGASGEATVAVGLGAHVLVGGSNRTIALQPLAVQGQVGLNLAVGVAELRLRHAR
jgi:Protein of unknown function (DUF992)